jgi:mycothiol synthase
MPSVVAERAPVGSPDGLRRIRALHDAALALDGHESMGEAVWRDLAAPGPASSGFLATRDGVDVAYAHVAALDTAVADRYLIGLCVHPDARDDPAVAVVVLDESLAWITDLGGGHAVLWLHGVTDGGDAAALGAGFAAARDLIEMRVRLPLHVPLEWPPGIEVRAFRPGADDAAWLAVNNRAFAGHPEQGDWEPATLHRRMAEPWFDPELLRLAFDADGLVGSIWMKLHEQAPGAGAHELPLGEIFVIGVDPRAQELRLGRPLAICGLDLVSARGAPVGMLFVAAEHARARRLYTSLGFHEHRRDRAYERDVP